MEQIVVWICDNKEWLFSGIGLVVFAGIVRFLLGKITGRPAQTIQSGDGSVNIQSGRDLNIGTKTGTNVDDG